VSGARLRTPVDPFLLAHVAAAIAFIGAVFTVLDGIGSGTRTLVVAIATVAPLFVLARPWRLPWWLLTMAAAMPAAPLIVALAHGELAGVDRIGKYAYFGMLLVSLLGWAITPARRLWLGLGVVALGLVELVPSVSSWVEGGDPSRLLVGLLQWHNQYADFELVPYAVAAGIAVFGARALPLPRPIRAVLQAAAGIAAAVIGASILPTASRYGIALGGAVSLVVLATAILVGIRRRQWWILVRAAALAAGVAAAAIILTSPLLFPQSQGGVGPADPLHNVLARSNAGNDSFNGRTPLWTAALRMGAAHPLVGAGLLQFARYAPCYAVQKLTALEWHPHDDWLYGWAEGGIVGLLPLLALTAALVVLAVRRLRPLPSMEALVGDAARWGGLVAIGAATAALVLEYDLVYPPILAMIAAAGGLAGAGRPPAPGATRTGRAALVAFLALALLVVVGFVAVAIDPLHGGAPWIVERPYPSTCSAP